MHLALPKRFPLFILAFSVCWSLQCLIPALTQGGGGRHLFRLPCSVLQWGGRNTANKYYWRVWGVLAVSGSYWVAPAHSVCAFLVYTAQAPGSLQGNCLKQALGCVHFPGLSHSGSGSWVLHKGTDLVGPAICALPRSLSLGMWCVFSPPWSQLLGFLGGQWEHHLRYAMCLFWGADHWL